MRMRTVKDKLKTWWPVSTRAWTISILKNNKISFLVPVLERPYTACFRHFPAPTQLIETNGLFYSKYITLGPNWQKKAKNETIVNHSFKDADSLTLKHRVIFCFPLSSAYLLHDSDTGKGTSIHCQSQCRSPHKLGCTELCCPTLACPQLFPFPFSPIHHRRLSFVLVLD